MNKSWHLTPLSNDQKARLSILAKAAWNVAQQRGAIEDGVKFDDWRYAQQEEACGVASLREANQSHYLHLRGKWFTILGNLEQAFYDFMNGGEQNERTRQLKWRLAGAAAVLSDGIREEKARVQIVLDEAQAAVEAWNYTRALCADKFQRRRIDQLDADELEELCFTVINRANAKLGKGKAEHRNKRQREKRKAAKAVFSGSEESLETPSSDRINELLEAEAERTHGHVQDTRRALLF